MCACLIVFIRAGHLQTALSFLLNAKDYALPEIEVEWARYKNTQVGVAVLTVTGHFPANLGICPVNFSLCLTKLILAAMYVG